MSEAQVVEILHFCVPFCTTVQFLSHVKIQLESHVSNSVVRESLLHFYVLVKVKNVHCVTLCPSNENKTIRVSISRTRSV